MKPASFDYVRAESIEEALRHLARGDGQAKVIAGGQSFAPMLNMRLATPQTLVDVNDLSELSYIREQGSALEIGALTRHHQLAESELVRAQCPLLAQAASTIGHYAIRQRGTLGGSLAHADPAAQLPLVAVTLDSTVELGSVRGRRSVPARAFFLSAMSTALAADEMVLAVHFPKAPQDSGSAFELFSRRRGDFAIVSVATRLSLDGDRVQSLQLGVGGAEGVPRDCAPALQDMLGRPADTTWVEQAAVRVAAAVRPMDDGRIEVCYRQELTTALCRQALSGALARARGG